jgi:hypothetical protein
MEKKWKPSCISKSSGRHKDNQPLSLAITHAYAPQQSASAEDREQFFADLDIAMTRAAHSDLNILTMDMNCSIGTLPKDSPPLEEKISVCGKYGDPHINRAGMTLKTWLSNYCMYATSTHFKHPTHRRDGNGTWRHPQSKKLYQNDHIFIQRNQINRVIDSRSQAPSCHSDRPSIKATLRIQLKLAKKKAKCITDRIKATNLTFFCRNITQYR